MEFINEQGKINAGKLLYQISTMPQTQISNFDFEDAQEAKELLIEFYRREMHHIENDSMVLNDYAGRVIDWMQSSKRGLLMIGRTGCGKTTMMNAVCKMINALYYSNISGTGTNADRRAFQWETAYTIENFARNERERYENFKRCEWAAIDDMGQESVSVTEYGNIVYPVRDILLYRYENNLTTIVTTNLLPKVITEKYGPRIGDRMAEMFETIMFNEDTYRR